MAGEKEDISNRNLLKDIIYIGAIPFCAALIAWGSNSEKVSAVENKVDLHSKAHAAEIETIEAEVKVLQGDVSATRTDVEVIKANQTHFREKIDDIQLDQQEILRILRREYINGANGGH